MTPSRETSGPTATQTPQRTPPTPQPTIPSPRPTSAGSISVVSVAVSPDDRQVYTVGNHGLAVFGRDPETRELSLEQVFSRGVDDVPGLETLADVAVSPDAGFVYVVSYEQSSVTVFARDSASDLLRFVQIVRNLEDGVTHMNNPTTAAASPDGGHLYVSNGSAVVVFSRDVAEGTLTFVEAVASSAGFLASMKISPSGATVYLAGSLGIDLFRRDVSGRLTVLASDACEFCIGVAASPDERHVYLTESTSDPGSKSMVETFALESGELSFVAGATVPYPASAVEVSGDGENVYVISAEPASSVTVFRRDPRSGELTFVERDSDGTIADGFRMALSHDGKSLYVAPRLESVLTVYDRAADGTLDFLQSAAALVDQQGH